MNEPPNFDHVDFFPSLPTLKGGEDDFDKQNKNVFFWQHAE